MVQSTVSLRQHERKAHGRAYHDNVGFRVNLPNRQSFSPDVAWHIGPSTGMKFLDGAPVFAVEVRSEYDYGPVAEQMMAPKRADYFAAETQVVWHVDLLGTEVIKCYDANNPTTPRVFRRGDIADAEPAVPGWRMPVEELSVSTDIGTLGKSYPNASRHPRARNPSAFASRACSSATMLVGLRL